MRTITKPEESIIASLIHGYLTGDHTEYTPKGIEKMAKMEAKWTAEMIGITDKEVIKSRTEGNINAYKNRQK